MSDLPLIDERLSGAILRYADSAVTPRDAMAITRAARVPVVQPRDSTWRHQRPLAVIVGLGLMVALLLATLAAIGQQPAGDPVFAPGSIAFTRAGALFVADPDGQDARLVASVDPTTDEAIVDFAFAPGGRALAYFDEAGASADFQRRMDIVGADGTVLASLDGCCRRFTWGPDGRSLAIRRSDYQLSIVGLDGATSMELPLVGIPDASGAFDLAWSPDGRWIAVTACDGIPYCKFDHDWLLVAADGSGTRWLDHGSSSGPANAGGLDWSDDSRVVLAGMADLAKGPGPSAAVQVVSPDDGLLAVIPILFWAADAAWWAPGSSRLLVEGRPRDNSPVSALAVADLVGTSVVLATDPVVLDGAAGWSADGRQVLFLGSVGGSHGMWAIDTDGGDPRLLIGDSDGYEFDIARPQAGGQ